MTAMFALCINGRQSERPDWTRKLRCSIDLLPTDSCKEQRSLSFHPGRKTGSSDPRWAAVIRPPGDIALASALKSASGDRDE